MTSEKIFVPQSLFGAMKGKGWKKEGRLALREFDYAVDDSFDS